VDVVPLLRHVVKKSDRNTSPESEESPVCRHDVRDAAHFGASGRFIAVTCIQHHSSTGYLLRI